MQPVKRGDVPRLIGRTKGGLNSKLHAVGDGQGRPVRLLLTEGQQSGHKGAATLLPGLPASKEVLGDKGYDSDAYRAALIQRGITPCIPPGSKRKNPATYCKTLYKERHKVENMFAKLKNWRRIAMRFAFGNGGDRLLGFVKNASAPTGPKHPGLGEAEQHVAPERPT